MSPVEPMPGDPIAPADKDNLSGVELFAAAAPDLEVDLHYIA